MKTIVRFVRTAEATGRTHAGVLLRPIDANPPPPPPHTHTHTESRYTSLTENVDAGWEMGKGRTEGGLVRIDGGFAI